jgi:stage II sporulation protein AA (anti-sigma F factor antagonist)
MACARNSRLRLSGHNLCHGRTVIVPVGEIDLENRDDFRSVLEATDGDVVVDLVGLTYIDSSGIGVLVAQRNRLTATGGTLQLRDPQPNVRQVLEIVGLETWLI